MEDFKEVNNELDLDNYIKTYDGRLIGMCGTSKVAELEEIAWKLYLGGIKVHWRATPLLREDFSKYNDYRAFMEAALIIYDRRIESRKKLKKPLTVIEVPASGKSTWYGGAFVLIFVYSRYKGNFIISGYSNEAEEYLKKNYTHYFAYKSMWHAGKSRGFWDFWKSNIGIFAPSDSKKHVTGKERKYSIRQYSEYKSNGVDDMKTLYFKRLPKYWIPEFNTL